MNYTEDELIKQGTEIKTKVLYVLAPIGLILFAIFYFQNNSLDYKKRKYVEFQQMEIKNKIINKTQEGNYPRARRYVLLDNYLEENVEMETYREISIGDSVIKRRGEDSVFFHLKSGRVIIEDDAKYLRESYEKLLNK